MRHGFLLVDKPLGPTSHDVVQTVRRALPERDVGHLGTLDPQASGLLVLAVGSKALKVVELFSGLNKEYKAHIRFGEISTTYDAAGTLEAVALKPGWIAPEQGSLQRIISDQFVGKIDQVPPGYSAIHIAGERAYRKMQQGKNVVMPSRKVEVLSYHIDSYNFPDLHVTISCSAGTYIRSLAHDLGQVLGCGAHLGGLRRTKVGQWRVEDAALPANVAWTQVSPLKEILASLPKVEISSLEGEALRHGKDIDHEVHPDTIAWCEGLPMALLVPCKDGTRRAHPRKVF